MSKKGEEAVNKILGLKQKRLVCTVLEEIRKMDKTRNYTELPSLIEEVQVYVDRMEDGLYESSTATVMMCSALEEGDVKKAWKVVKKRWPGATDFTKGIQKHKARVV